MRSIGIIVYVVIGVVVAAARLSPRWFLGGGRRRSFAHLH